MEEIIGKFNTAISFAKTIESTAREQIRRMCIGDTVDIVEVMKPVYNFKAEA